MNATNLPISRLIGFLAAAAHSVMAADATLREGSALRPGLLRALLGFERYHWVEDTAVFTEKLAIARVQGYNTFICHFESPRSRAGEANSAWRRGPESGYRWTLSDRNGSRGAGARQALVGRIRTVKRVVERNGLIFIPDVGAMGWGADYAAIDSGTLAGVYYDIRLPESRENLFRADRNGVIVPEGGWGDRGGKAQRDSNGTDKSRVRIALQRAGMFAAHFRIEAPWDAYLRCQMPVNARAGSGDSAFLKAYEFNGWERHPHSTKPVALAGAGLASGTARLEVAFFVKRGRTYFLDLEYQCRSGAGGNLTAGQGNLERTAPPRNLILNVRGDEAMRARVSAREPRLRGAAWDSLNATAADSAWSSLLSVQGTFRDLSPEAESRSPVDPLAPATRQITEALLDAVAEACGPQTRYLHLGGDEVFSLQRSLRQTSQPYGGMSKAGLYAHLILDRMAQADSVFARRFPHSPAPVYIIYGDMLTSMSGIEAGTLDALDSLGPERVGRGRLIVMPWYYATHVRGLPFTAVFPKPDPGRPEGLLRVLREDARRLSSAGVDFLGLYSTDGNSASWEEQIRGAEMWNTVCGEYARAGTGRCLGLAYAGWDTSLSGHWGRNYNGLVMLARPWRVGHEKRPFQDADGNGIMDDLIGKPGPSRAR